MAKSDKTADLEKPLDDTPVTNRPAAPALPSRVMYVGPSMAEDGSVFSHGQIFNNGLPADWATKALLEPAFRRLLVPLNRVPKALADLRDPQSMLSLSAGTVAADYEKRKAAAR